MLRQATDNVAELVPSPPRAALRFVGSAAAGVGIFAEMNLLPFVFNAGTGPATIDVLLVTALGTFKMVSGAVVGAGTGGPPLSPTGYVVLREGERLDIVLKSSSDPAAKLNVLSDFGDMTGAKLERGSIVVDSIEGVTVIPSPGPNQVHALLGNLGCGASMVGALDNSGAPVELTFDFVDEAGTALQMGPVFSVSENSVAVVPTSVLHVRRGQQIRARLIDPADRPAYVFPTYLVVGER